MYQKLQKKDCYILKLGPLTMPRQRFGKINPTTIKVTYGLSAVFYMKWQR
jgi:hypothetical protein